MDPLEVAKRTYSEFSDDDCTTQGAALAYYTVFSLAPLLLMVISIAGLILGRQTVQQQIQAQVTTLIGSDAAQQIGTMLQHAQSHSGGWLGAAIGLFTLILGATGTFGSLQDALNRVWHVKPDPHAGGVRLFLTKRLLSFGIIMGLAFLLLVSLALSAILSAVGSVIARYLPKGLSAEFLHSLGFLSSFVVITIILAAIFKILPDARIEWHHVWVGAVLTSILFTVGKELIGLYLGKTAVASAYGAAGSFVVIVVWLYYSSLILLFGAEFTKVWSMRSDGMVKPEPGAVHVEVEEHHQRV
jgi:membrane protein